MDLRVRVLGRVLRPGSIARMDDARVRRAQTARIGHNVVTDLLFGGVAAGAQLSDGTAAGQVGPLPVRVYRRQHPAAGPRPLVPAAVSSIGGVEARKVSRRAVGQVLAGLAAGTGELGRTVSVSGAARSPLPA